MKEALKLALEALEAIYTVGDVACVVKPEGEIYLKPVIDKCKAALAQPDHIEDNLAMVQPEPEPVLQDIEQYRMQIAGICTAAIGYWKEGDSIHPAYDTLALRDVAKLYAKYDALYKAPQRQPEERNFCPRCGKRTADLTLVHTCTPPIAADPKAFHGFPSGSASTPNAGGKCVTAGETAPIKEIDPNQWAFDRGLEST